EGASLATGRGWLPGRSATHCPLLSLPRSPIHEPAPRFCALSQKWIRSRNAPTSPATMTTCLRFAAALPPISTIFLRSNSKTSSASPALVRQLFLPPPRNPSTSRLSRTKHDRADGERARPLYGDAENRDRGSPLRPRRRRHSHRRRALHP